MTVTIQPLNTPPDVIATIPGSKSHTNRALICAALARGRSVLKGALFADDTEAMVGALTDLGVVVEPDAPAEQISVEGTGGTVAVRDASINVRQSGTTGRFIIPMLAHSNGTVRVDGHQQLRARPFGPLTAALRQAGVRVDGDALPITVHGGGWDQPVRLDIAGDISSQYLSGLLLAAPASPAETTIVLRGALVSRPYIDLTLSTMRTFGAEVTEPEPGRFVIEPSGYTGTITRMEPDASAASYFFAAAAITGGRVRVNGLGTSTIQGDLRFVDALASMGATVTQGPDWTEVHGTGTLRGIDIDMADISDTAQTLAIVATFADGPSTLRGIGFIRAKETDRLAAVVNELQALGIRAEAFDDGMTIWPGGPISGTVATYEDHRMAMSFALLGLRHPGITIADPGCVAKTFPRYFEELTRLRMTEG